MMSQSSTDHENVQAIAAVVHSNGSNGQAESEETNGATEPSQESNGLSVPARKRTRATAEQLAVLEDTFAVNISPNNKLRKQLAERLHMTERSIQIWFQNRRAKVKHMQKRAQMQMQQASLRAQLYHYQHQQYGYNGAGVASLQPHYPYRPYPPVGRMPLSRAQSVDAVSHLNQQQQQPLSASHAMRPFSSTPGPTSVPPSVQHTTPTPPPSHQAFYTPPPSMPPTAYGLVEQTLVDPSLYSLDSRPSKPDMPYPPPADTFTAAMPTLMAVPDAGPTAVLTTDLAYAPTTPAATPPIMASETGADFWSSQDSQVLMGVQEARMFSPQQNSALVTIDPSSLMMTPPASTNSHTGDTEDVAYINASTLTIGVWHRLKLSATDLLCAYEPVQRQLVWHIADNGYHFKMEIPLESVSCIEYLTAECNVLADVHIDITQPPRFYMKSKTPSKEKEPQKHEQAHWIQCSDFTEGKQASHFLRHTLKGVAHHMKQELLNLMKEHEEISPLVRFAESFVSFPQDNTMVLMQQQQQQKQQQQQQQQQDSSLNPMYWNTLSASHSLMAPSFMNEQAVACGFMS